MVAALEERQKAMAGDAAAEAGRRALRDQWIARLQSEVPGVEILGSPAPRLWNTVAALMPPAADCRRRWVVRLDRLGFAASTGSACSSGKEVPSPILESMGHRPGASDRMIRFSSGWETQASAWDGLLGAIVQVATEFGLR